MSGHIFDMVYRIAQNKTSKPKFKGDNRAHINGNKADGSRQYHFSKISELPLARLRSLIQKEALTDHRKSAFYYVLSIVIAAGSVWAFVSLYDAGRHASY